MTRKDALKILGMSATNSQEEIKKRYRSLMLQTHPDVTEESDYPYDAGLINVAYEYLMKNVDDPEEIHGRSVQPEKTGIRWNALINPNAYVPRNIYHSVEDSDGAVVGEAILDRGKYCWTEDEDFSSFLKSLYECSKEIVQQHNPSEEENLELLSQIAYLLSQQYVDAGMVLSSFTEQVKEDIYHIGAMLEMDRRFVLKAGDILYPSAIRKHRLYVSDVKGRELGYLSFKDDRLYYGIIPLFERRTVLLKMKVAEDTGKRLNGKRYQDVDLLLKLLPEDYVRLVESINKKIEDLLERGY